jgi:hypothetical protein
MLPSEAAPDVNGNSIQLRLETQRNSVADEVAAITAVVRPILQGTLYSLKRDIVQNVGGYEKITLQLLARLYRAGDGDCGICFAWSRMSTNEPRAGGPPLVE